eukprot:637836-Amphidinium_carterae.1
MVCKGLQSAHQRPRLGDLLIITIIIDFVHFAHHLSLHEMVILGIRHQFSIPMDSSSGYHQSVASIRTWLAIRDF